MQIVISIPISRNNYPNPTLVTFFFGPSIITSTKSEISKNEIKFWKNQNQTSNIDVQNQINN